MKIFFQKEKDISISILNGLSIPKCAEKFEEEKARCITIVNHFCMKSNYYLYEKLQPSLFESAPITELRKHSRRFIEDSVKLEKVTIDSPIWALTDVPMMTLNALWKYKNHTIKDLLEHGERDLLQYKNFGKMGLEQLKSALALYGFSLKNRTHKRKQSNQMQTQELFELLEKIDKGEIIPGTITGKFYIFKGIQKYSGRGRFSNLKGTDVVVLESRERKGSIILFLEPLLLLLDGDLEDLAYGKLPVGYAKEYYSGEPIEIPNLFEYESHYKALARYILQRAEKTQN